MYVYKAEYISNYDGDTIKFNIDLGFDTWRKITVRVKGIDTPELRGGTKESKQAAKDAKIFVETELMAAKTITIKTEKDKTGKYGRYIADVIYNKTDIISNQLSISKILLQEGLAKIYGE